MGSELNNWNTVKMEDLFENISIKKQSELPVLSATQTNGIVYRDELDINIKYDKKSLDNYKLVSPGNFVISLRSFQGGIELSRIQGIVSPAYTILKSKVEINQEFFKYYFKSFVFMQSLKKTIVGIRDGKQIKYDDFKSIKMGLPSLKEQKKIADILSKMDKQIEQTGQIIEQTKELKHGLMQQLLTKGIGNKKFKDSIIGNVPDSWKVKLFFDNIDKIFDYRGRTPKK